jgi:excisionase family DNA binding protein
MSLTTVEDVDQAIAIHYPERLLLRVEEAAELLGIARTLMYRLLLTDEVESVHVGRLRRVPIDAVREYVTRLRSAERTAAS